MPLWRAVDMRHGKMRLYNVLIVLKYHKVVVHFWSDFLKVNRNWIVLLWIHNFLLLAACYLTDCWLPV